jgi:hypothetical protein
MLSMISANDINRMRHMRMRGPRWSAVRTNALLTHYRRIAANVTNVTGPQLDRGKTHAGAREAGPDYARSDMGRNMGRSAFVREL